MKKILCLSLMFFFFTHALVYAQSPGLQMLSKGNKTNIRGLSVVDDHVIWVSGDDGIIGKTTDGGQNWKWMTVKGFEKNDFRDIEAFDAVSAVIMSVSEPAYILKTNNGGDSWKVVYENKTKGIFLDAMEFWNKDAGIIIGDPIDGKFFITRSFDGGSTWQDIPFDKRPLADSGEACFAASGTNIRALDLDEAVFVSGGMRSRLFTKDAPKDLDFVKGKETAGANSVAVWDHLKKNGGRQMIVVGGDFNADTSSLKNCFISSDRGNTWNPPQTAPHGYRSCVEYASQKMIFCCGLTGIDVSTDGGQNWQWTSHESFNVCRVSPSGTLIYFAGSNGRVGKISL